MAINSLVFDLERPALLNPREDLICEVQRGLSKRPRSLAPWIFYDAYGSRLFERITRLKEHYLTRTERGILENSANDIIAWTRAGKRNPLRLLELGAGTAEKTCILLEAIGRIQDKTSYIPVDVSSDALLIASQRIHSRLPDVSVELVVANYTTHLPPLAPFEGTTLALYIGFSIGNFSPQESRTILQSLRTELRAGDALLLGTDLVKEVQALMTAYDDKDGITAAFNLNVLERLNRELGADFKTENFRYRVVWNPLESRIEMHLESRREQRVQVADANLDLHFTGSETIHTENSYKFTQESAAILLEQSGFEVERSWTDERGWFAVTLARR